MNDLIQWDVIEPHPAGGWCWRKFFPNGYGVSVARNGMSYGHERGLYELAVIVGTPHRFSMCYHTPITDDVIGHLTAEDVFRSMAEVEALPSVTQEIER